jgi:hypothetical protein
MSPQRVVVAATTSVIRGEEHGSQEQFYLLFAVSFM